MSETKEEVTRQKVLRYYSSCNPNAADDDLLMRELGKETGNKVMPFVMAWAGRGDSLTTLLYRLVRQDPAAFAPVRGNRSFAGKRKCHWLGWVDYSYSLIWGGKQRKD